MASHYVLTLFIFCAASEEIITLYESISVITDFGIITPKTINK